MSEKSRIGTDLELDADGKQVTRLFVPNPSNASAWGAIVVPIASIKRGDGPRVLLTGGAHGDEYEGPLALWEVMRELSPGAMRGQVIVVPTMNVPGMQAGCRSFPGDPRGTPTSALAHYISSELLPRVDAVVDFHSGGRSLSFLPCGVMHQLPDPERAAKTEALLQAFGAPWALVLEELDAVGMLDTLVEDMGKTFLTTELRGGGRVSPEAARIARRGIWNVLAHLGVTDARPDAVPEGRDATRYLEVPDRTHYTLSPSAGIWEPTFELGDRVEAGQVVGRIHHPEAKRSGVLMAERVPALTAAGDTLAVIARER